MLWPNCRGESEGPAEQGHEPFPWLNEEVSKGSSTGIAQNPISKDGAVRPTSMMSKPCPYLSLILSAMGSSPLIKALGFFCFVFFPPICNKVKL